MRTLKDDGRSPVVRVTYVAADAITLNNTAINGSSNPPVRNLFLSNDPGPNLD